MLRPGFEPESSARKAGMLDLPLLKYTIMMNDVDSLAITKVDILGKMKTIKVATKYTIDGKEIDYFPRRLEEFDKLHVDYVEFPGWGDITNGEDIISKGYQELPENMKKFLEFIEGETGKTIDIISLGEDRRMTITKQIFN